MGSHEWADHAERTTLGPAPGRLRLLVGRSAAIVLILGALAWISVSLLFNPPPRAPEAGQGIPLEVVESATAGAEPGGQAGDPPAASGRGTGAPNSPGPATGAGEAGEAGEPESGGATVVVHMIGAVKDPGVYGLPLGSRVLDAVQRAGGLAQDAAPEAINLAAEVTDGEQIRIPRRGEATPAPAPEAGIGGGGRGPDAAASGPDKINVNTASAAELAELPGIGPTLSGRIVAFRESNGPFRNLGELDAVSGIGPGMLGNLRDLVVFE